MRVSFTIWNDVVGKKHKKEMMTVRNHTSFSVDLLGVKIFSVISEAIEKYKNGNDKLFGFFVGEAMKLSKGKANPKILNELLKSKLNT